MDEKLKTIYYDAAHPAGFSGASKLSKADGVPLRKTEEWLEKQRAYTLHKPRRKKFKTRRYLVNRRNKYWQADLIDVSEYAWYNKNVHFLLTVIDIFDKFAWVVALKRKNAVVVAAAFEELFSHGW